MSNCAWLNAWRRKGNEILLLPAWAHVMGASLPPWDSLEELSSWVCCPQDPGLQTPLSLIYLSRDHLQSSSFWAWTSSFFKAESPPLWFRCLQQQLGPVLKMLVATECSRNGERTSLPKPVIYLFYVLWWSAPNAEVFSITLSKQIPCRNW